MYSIAIGLEAKDILEIGFGRSSFVLAKAAYEMKSTITFCDTRNFSYLLSDPIKDIAICYWAQSAAVWADTNKGYDFAFLDYFSSESISSDFVIKEITTCLTHMKENGVIAIHDGIVDTYPLKDVISQLIIDREGEIEVMTLPYNYGLTLIRNCKPSNFGTISDSHFKKQDT